MGAYVFDNSWEKERVRLAGIEAMLDPGMDLGGRQD